LILTSTDKSHKILEATRLPQEYSKKDELLLRMNSMRLKESYVAYPWEQKMQTYLPVSGSATVFSLLVMPVALSPKSREYADVEDTSARAVAWLSAAQASGVPISCVNIQTEPLFLQVGHPVVTTKLKIGCVGCYIWPNILNQLAVGTMTLSLVSVWQC
jgi:hypothetical protein